MHIASEQATVTAEAHEQPAQSLPPAPLPAAMDGGDGESEAKPVRVSSREAVLSTDCVLPSNDGPPSVPSPENHVYGGATADTTATEAPSASAVTEEDSTPFSIATEPHAAPVAAPVEATQTKPTRRKRGTNPAGDTNSARLFILAMLAVIGDLKLGGYEQAAEAHRAAAGGTHLLKLVPEIKDVPKIFLNLCQWIVHPVYLNCEGSSDYHKLGLHKYYAGWAANRLYYFYRTDHRTEHPRGRKRGNLGTVYREIYDHFHGRVGELTPITEDEAKAFMMSVSDRVPFSWPKSAVAPVVDNAADLNGEVSNG